MRFDRLVIESGSSTFSLDFHPRLTVIAGVGRLERDGLVNELLSALGPGRAGVHVELSSDTGSRYAVFRPVGGHPRIVDIDLERDVTESFVDEEGRVDLLQRAGLSVADAKQRLRVSASDLAVSSAVEDHVRRLARIDQARLWDVARKVTERQALLDEAAAAAGSVAEDAEVFREIDRRHEVFESAMARHDGMRRAWFLLAGISAIGAVPAATVLGALAAIPLILGAAATTVASILSWREMEDAREDEYYALQRVGAATYLDFHVSRTNGLVANDFRRKEMMAAADHHRAALVEWELLVGEVPVRWAVEHQREIRAAAAFAGPAPVSGRMLGPARADDERRVPQAGAVIDAFARKLAAARTSGRDERLPIILDDPFGGAGATDPEAAAALLARLTGAAGAYQLIYLAADATVPEWTHREALAGNLAVIAPRTADNGAPPKNRDVTARTSRRSRHVAA